MTSRLFKGFTCIEGLYKVFPPLKTMAFVFVPLPQITLLSPPSKS